MHANGSDWQLIFSQLFTVCNQVGFSPIITLTLCKIAIVSTCKVWTEIAFGSESGKEIQRLKDVKKLNYCC